MRIWILMQTTVSTFVSEYTATIASHASRIESFNRMVSHELRQPLGTLMYALPLLKAESKGNDTGRQEHFLGVMERNIVKLMQLMDQLETLSRLQTVHTDAPDVQHTESAVVAWEVARQLREMGDARNVDIQIGDDLPDLVVDRARLELILTNLISNGIKYSDPDKRTRFVRVEAGPCEDASTACLAVRDNGLGIPPESLATVFRRFVRAPRVSRCGARGARFGPGPGHCRGMRRSRRRLHPGGVLRRRGHHLLRHPAARAAPGNAEVAAPASSVAD